LYLFEDNKIKVIRFKLRGLIDFLKGVEKDQIPKLYANFEKSMGKTGGDVLKMPKKKRTITRPEIYEIHYDFKNNVFQELEKVEDSIDFVAETLKDFSKTRELTSLLKKIKTINNELIRDSQKLTEDFSKLIKERETPADVLDLKKKVSRILEEYQSLFL
jgi:hypothetical protein